MIPQQIADQAARAVARQFADMGLRERARQLRLAVEWARLNNPRWRQALEGLALSLNSGGFAVRLEAHTATGGAAIMRLEGDRLHLLRVELGWSLSLGVDVPASVLVRN